MGFTAPGRQLSIARIQIVLGFAYLGFLLLRASLSKAPSTTENEVMTYLFVVAIIIIVVGMIALVLEERLTWLPLSLRIWLETSSIAIQNDAHARSKPAEKNGGAPPDAQQSSATPTAQSRPATPRWGLAGGRELPDIAVAQLLVMILLLPVLMFIWRKLPVDGWRLVLIVALSEMVYLAFLAAQMIKTRELEELVKASLDLDKQLEELAKANLDLDKQLKEESAEDKKKALEAARSALQARAEDKKKARSALQERAAALWKQLSPMFESQSPAPKL